MLALELRKSYSVGAFRRNTEDMGSGKMMYSPQVQFTVKGRMVHADVVFETPPSWKVFLLSVCHVLRVALQVDRRQWSGASDIHHVRQFCAVRFGLSASLVARSVGVVFRFAVCPAM